MKSVVVTAENQSVIQLSFVNIHNIIPVFFNLYFQDTTV